MKRTRLKPGAKSLKRGSTFARARALKNTSKPATVEYEIYLRSEFKRKVCGRPCEQCGTTHDLEAHHVLAAAVLRSYIHTQGLTRIEAADVLWDSRNGMCLCGGALSCHARHTFAHQRIPRHLLRPCHWEFADGLGLTWRLEQDYPEQEVA